MSIEIMRSMQKFISINNDRLDEGKSSLCRTEYNEVIRDYLPCNNKNPNGEFIIQCEDCPFYSSQAGKETILELDKIIKRKQVKNMLLGTQEEDSQGQ